MADNIYLKGHGVAKFEGSNKEKSLGVFTVLRSGVVVFMKQADIPTNTRQLVSRATVEHVLKVMNEPLKVDTSIWNKTYRECMELVDTGEFMNIVEVHRKLIGISNNKQLSFGERKLFSLVNELLNEEINMVKGASK